LSYQLFNRYVL